MKGFSREGQQAAKCGQGEEQIGMQACPARGNIQTESLWPIQIFVDTHSHSIVPGGFEVMSYTTRFTPRTSFTIRFEIVFSTSYGSGTQSAVMPSSECTARMAQV